MPIQYKAIPKREWTIPTKHLDQALLRETEARSSDSKKGVDYKTQCELLESLGFESLKHNETLRIADLRYRFSKEEPDYFDLYLHPMGILIYMDSYTSGGYTSEEGEQVPLRRIVNRCDVTTQVDVGFLNQKSAIWQKILPNSPYMDLYNTNAENSKSGSTLLNIKMDCKDKSIIRILSEIQGLGHFIPVSKWGMSPFVYLYKELYTDWNHKQDFQGHDEASLLSIFEEEVEEQRQTFLNSLPENLRSFFAYQTTEVLSRNFDEASKSELRLQKEVFEYIGTVLSYGENRFAEADDELWTSQALQAALTGPTATPTEVIQFLLEKAPSGIHFGNVLLESAPHQVKAWLDVIPPSVLKRWVEEPNAAGVTLPIQLFQMVTTPFHHGLKYASEKAQANRESWSIQWLSQTWMDIREKVGLESLNQGFESASFSLLGVLYLAYENNKSYRSIQRKEYEEKDKMFFEELHGLIQEGFKLSDRVQYIQWQDNNLKTMTEVLEKVDEPLSLIDNVKMQEFFALPQLQDLRTEFEKQKLQKALPESNPNSSGSKLRL